VAQHAAPLQAWGWQRRCRCARRRQRRWPLHSFLYWRTGLEVSGPARAGRQRRWPLHSFLYWRTGLEVGGPARAGRRGAAAPRGYPTPRGARPLRTPKVRPSQRLCPLSCLWSAECRHRAHIQSNACATATQLITMQLRFFLRLRPKPLLAAAAAKGKASLPPAFQPLRHDSGRSAQGCISWRGSGGRVPFGCAPAGCRGWPLPGVRGGAPA
jgi:hypothetical protein